ncbi:tectonic-1-like isoform X2 [Pectinophora gossypiella]|uniref:tectonic-1-like isoform X2 n=1 Tax=Pectinophora gossypiella TaxID=13191 RepID=UPI00214EB393|nr:tectonic-1-like isoform X2 [Pectinophora gossypiella]
MKVITYFAFTVLSVVIQFVVMDLIQEKLNIDDDKKVEFNATSVKRSFSDVVQYPQALYYRTPYNKNNKSPVIAKTYSNSSIPEITLETSTDLTSTLIDLLYDENSSVTEGFFTTVTESLDMNTEEIDNVTEVSIFGIKNITETKPKYVPKKTENTDCYCNLLHKVCDINCCCDSDCTDTQREMFECSESVFNGEDSDSFCYSQLYLMGSSIDNFFCVVKSNLPDKRKIIHQKHDPDIVNKAFKWHSSHNRNVVQAFKKALYKYGDPVWLLQNGSATYLDLPSTMVNNYCNDRKPIKFLRDETMKCNVKLTDLEALQILNIVEKTSVISVTANSFNTSALVLHPLLSKI